MKHAPLQFVRHGRVVTLDGVRPDRTLLEVLREDLGCTAVKEGCGEGDCSACTVVLGEPRPEGGLSYRAINSCIRPAHAAHARAVWTAEDLPAGADGLHPCQQAMVAYHGSQCGFCTPGFVMSLFGMYQNRVLQGETVDRETAQAVLSGNLCRCTGYRPILDAAVHMGELPRVTVDEGAVRTLLAQIPADPAHVAGDGSDGLPDYAAPLSLEALLRWRADHPEAQLVAGCTDVGLWITKQHRSYARILDLTRVGQLRRIELRPGQPARLRIGAAVTLEDAYAALCQRRPQLRRFAQRFAGLPVRSSGTLGGNVANGSPIGDSMPLLLALNATLVLASVRGAHEVPLSDFYTGYRKNLLAPDEVLVHIDVPEPLPGEYLQVYKVSKRQDDDISAVCLAVWVQVHEGRIAQVRIGAGGVAATPVRARATEALLLGQPWNADTLYDAEAVLGDEFAPISDMRASAAYRRSVLARLLRRYAADAGLSLAAGQLASLDALAAPGVLDGLV